MESYNTDCDNANKDYIKKYNSLISMVNGYDQFNDNNSLNQLTDLTGKIKKIINKTLISEPDFVKLKKEQNNIMNEYEKLEKIKTGDPFSKEALVFSKDLETKNDSSNLYNNLEKKFNINIEDKPQRKNIKLSKMPLDQKLSCDGSINQYYKMPNICININTKESKYKSKVAVTKKKSKVAKTKVTKKKSKVAKTKVTKNKSKVAKTKVTKNKTRIRTKSRVSRTRTKSKVSKTKIKNKNVKKLKCNLNNKINNHKLF